MLEKEVERRIVQYAKSRGIKTYKLNGDGDRGKPDRLFMREGVVLFLEIKRPKAKPRKLQLVQLQELNDMGFRAEWVDAPEKGFKLLDDIFS